jgi:hypothetical protein
MESVCSSSGIREIDLDSTIRVYTPMRGEM